MCTMKDFLGISKKKDDNRIVSQNCIYCHKNVNTANNTPVCSRKTCKKQYSIERQLKGNSHINYNEKLIEIEVSR